MTRSPKSPSREGHMVAVILLVTTSASRQDLSGKALVRDADDAITSLGLLR